MPINTTTAYATKQVTISNTALSLVNASIFTQAQIDAADFVLITTESAGVRLRYDGTAPTTTAGHLVPFNSSFQLYGQVNISQIQVIRDGTVDAPISITLEKNK